MGEARKDALWVGFDRAVKLEFHGAKVQWHQGGCSRVWVSL